MIHSSLSQRPYFYWLTPLRGLAALLVLLFHFWEFKERQPVRLIGIDWSPWLSSGYVGVDLFFVLSGFLLGYPFIQAQQLKHPKPSLKTFWIKRCKRVLPAYWFQIVILVMVGWLLQPELTINIKAVLLQALMLANIPNAVPLLNNVYWSLPVEWDFYIILPLLALCFTTKKRTSLSLTAILVWVFAFRWCMHLSIVLWGSEGTFIARWIIQLPARVDQFMLGMLAAWLHIHYAHTLHRLRMPLFAASTIGLLAYTRLLHELGAVFIELTHPWYLLHFSIIGLLFSCLVLASCLLGSPAKSWRWFWKPWVWLGTISYSLYLWHASILAWFNALPLAHEWPVFVLLVPILFVSWLSYRFIERPWQ